MRDRFRHLDREAKAVRHGLRPALIGRAPVRPMERRVDLDGIETAGVALKMASARWHLVKIHRWNVPSGGADPERRLRHRVIGRGEERFISSAVLPEKNLGVAR